MHPQKNSMCFHSARQIKTENGCAGMNLSILVGGFQGEVFTATTFGATTALMLCGLSVTAMNRVDTQRHIGRGHMDEPIWSEVRG